MMSSIIIAWSLELGAWSSLFLVKDLDSNGGFLRRRSTLDPRSNLRPCRLSRSRFQLDLGSSLFNRLLPHTLVYIRGSLFDIHCNSRLQSARNPYNAHHY